MTPTAEQMNASQLSLYTVKVRQNRKGLNDIEFPITDTVFTGVGRNNAAWIARERLKASPGVQVWIESDNFIVAISVHDAILWLEKVPPPNYWLNYRKRPQGEALYQLDSTLASASQSRIMAACGLPIPSCILEKCP